MDARRAVDATLKQKDAKGLSKARAAVNEAKVALGERGPVWWTDGAPDFNRRRTIAGTLSASMSSP